MILKPQDIVVLLKIIALKGQKWTYALIAHELHMSASEVHAGAKRANTARLMDLNNKKPLRGALEEFLVHGVKYVYPALRGDITRGVPTSYGAPPLMDFFPQSDAFPPVWPDPEGKVRGYELAPLYRTVPRAVTADTDFYELLALVDAIRDGRAREATLAIQELKARLQSW